MKKYAEYKDLKRGDMVSNGEHFGIVDVAAFDMVLISWKGQPPVYYPRDVWQFNFASNYVIVED